MKPFNTLPRTDGWHARFIGVVCVAALSACSVLKPSTTEPPAFYALNAAPTTVPLRAPDSATRTLPTLIITPTRAAAGFDSQRIIYVRHAHQLEYFAHNEWIDTPARMLGPLLASSMEATGAFGAVVVTPAGASGDLRLETDIIRLLHNFQTRPSRVQFTLRAYLLDDKTRRVLAWREFHGEATAPSDTPAGGVAAANQAVQAELTKLAQFVAAHPR
jgi:cholesterol transport system auxiliary component